MGSRIVELIEKGEGLSIEFKRCGLLPEKDTFETIYSFANRQGGHILLGVNDDGSIEGVASAARADVERNIVSVTNSPNLFSAALGLGFSHEEVDGRHVIDVWVPMRPSVYRCKGVAYDRMADLDVRLEGDEQVSALYIRKQNICTERRIYGHATEGDLDLTILDRVRSMVRASRPDVTVCRSNVDRYDDRLVVSTSLVDLYRLLCEFCRKWPPDSFALEGDARISVRDAVVPPSSRPGSPIRSRSGAMSVVVALHVLDSDRTRLVADRGRSRARGARRRPAIGGLGGFAAPRGAPGRLARSVSPGRAMPSRPKPSQAAANSSQAGANSSQAVDSGPPRTLPCVRRPRFLPSRS